MQCPGCSQDMTAQTLDGHYGRSVPLDWCPACGVVWFDADESIALTPGAVLKLFQVVAGEPPAPRAPLPDALRCPRCRTRLERTTDVVHGARFHYFRCPAEHGRLTPFAEVLREKSFVRPLAAAELAELRAKVKMVQCSSCGAPVDLAAASACGHCRAPVSILDPRQVERVVQELKVAEIRRTTEDPALALRLLEDRLATTRLFRDDGPRWTFGDDGAIDLVTLGMHALGRLFRGLD